MENYIITLLNWSILNNVVTGISTDFKVIGAL